MGRRRGRLCAACLAIAVLGYRLSLECVMCCCSSSGSTLTYNTTIHEWRCCSIVFGDTVCIKPPNYFTAWGKPCTASAVSQWRAGKTWVVIVPINSVFPNCKLNNLHGCFVSGNVLHGYRHSSTMPHQHFVPGGLLEVHPVPKWDMGQRSRCHLLQLVSSCLLPSAAPSTPSIC